MSCTSCLWTSPQPTTMTLASAVIPIALHKRPMFLASSQPSSFHHIMVYGLVVSLLLGLVAGVSSAWWSSHSAPRDGPATPIDPDIAITMPLCWSVPVELPLAASAPPIYGAK
eukprot:EG_transcript_26176